MSISPSKRNIINPSSPTKRHEQVGLNSPAVRNPVRTHLLDKVSLGWNANQPIPVNQAAFNRCRDPSKLIDSHEDDISSHLVARVSALWVQLISVKETGLKFAIGETDRQYFSEKRLKVVYAKKKTAEAPYAAAHSSTIPNLLFKKGKGFAKWLPSSHLETINNSTMGLPLSVNQVDSLVDGKEHQDKLRKYTIHLINQVASGKVIPEQALRKYLKRFKEIVAKNLKNADPLQKKILELFLHTLQKLREMAKISRSTQEVHLLFDPLLNINLREEAEEDRPILRKLLFEEKPAIIRQAFIAEEKIYSLLEENFNKKQRTLANHCLIYGAPVSLKRTLEKLFCISLTVSFSKQPWKEKVVKEYEENQQQYDRVLKKIGQLVAEYRRAELMFQANLIHRLRLFRKMSPKDLTKQATKCVAKRLRVETKRSKKQALQQIDITTEKIKLLEAIANDPKTNQNIEPLMIEILAEALNVESDQLLVSSFASR